MRVVLDTNVLISGIFFGGVPKRILKFWAKDRKYDLYVTTDILEEYLRVIYEIGLKIDRRSLSRAWVESLPKACNIVAGQIPRVCYTRDPNDDMFIACAISSKADCLVTGDNDLRDITEDFGFKILSPRQFLNSL